jgi:hypothetical protein
MSGIESGTSGNMRRATCLLCHLINEGGALPENHRAAMVLCATIIPEAKQFNPRTIGAP